MKTSYMITLPLPSPKLSPNARVHWAAKAKETKSLRGIAELTTTLLLRGESPKWSAATVQTTYFFKRAARRDKDNFQSMLKAAFDGITDSGLISDDSGLTHLPMVFHIDRANPRVEITITKG